MTDQGLKCYLNANKFLSRRGEKCFFSSALYIKSEIDTGRVFFLLEVYTEVCVKIYISSKEENKVRKIKSKKVLKKLSIYYITI